MEINALLGGLGEIFSARCVANMGPQLPGSYREAMWPRKAVRKRGESCVFSYENHHGYI